jgi:hypothetical protein
MSSSRIPYRIERAKPRFEPCRKGKTEISIATYAADLAQYLMVGVAMIWSLP